MNTGVIIVIFACGTGIAFAGEDCRRWPLFDYTSCGRISTHDLGNKTGKVVFIRPRCADREVRMYCDAVTDGGAWTVFQRRINGSLDFNRPWADYIDGFGDPAGEFWMGLELLHRLLREGEFELRIDLEDWEGQKSYAKYPVFKIWGPEVKYQLRLNYYYGTAGDSLGGSNGMPFSSFDKSPRGKSSSTCARKQKGGWWFKRCGDSNLNGLYYAGGNYSAEEPDGVRWNSWKNDQWYSMKFCEMKFRQRI